MHVNIYNVWNIFIFFVGKCDLSIWLRLGGIRIISLVSRFPVRSHAAMRAHTCTANQKCAHVRHLQHARKTVTMARDQSKADARLHCARIYVDWIHKYPKSNKRVLYDRIYRHIEGCLWKKKASLRYGGRTREEVHKTRSPFIFLNNLLTCAKIGHEGRHKPYIHSRSS